MSVHTTPLHDRRGFKAAGEECEEREPIVSSPNATQSKNGTAKLSCTASPGADKVLKASQKSLRVPEERPPFTIGDLKRAIPAHCFERSLLTSFRYLTVDVAVIALLYYSTTFFNHPSLPFFAPYILWPLYWLAQGFIMTGLWVVAHECGHGAFSDYEVVNDIVGWIAHSYLLVPYFSWKITHAKHHSKTANIDADAVFVPKLKDDHNGDLPSPIITFAKVVITLTLGWFFYLFINKSGNQKDVKARASHFNPYSPLFTPKERPFIVLSDLGILLCLATLTYLGYNYSFLWLLKVHLIPYFHVNFWLVLITNLQHTDLKLPHFRSEDWNWIQGALCTVDRDYGFLNVIFHHIGDTHVAHHLFSKMPHYHAQEATKALIPVLGKYYCRDDSSLWSAMWVATHNCQVVSPDEPNKPALWYN